jgi:hypothetical protein
LSNPSKTTKNILVLNDKNEEKRMDRKYTEEVDGALLSDSLLRN